MNINELITIIKKLYNNFDIEDILIEDKSYLQKSFRQCKIKFHLKITLTSFELKKMSKLE